ncbi:SgcJ/EcaC family oxidoreductase [Vibrio sp. Of14-4]|uniref:SgcJ/EcaC family oxidoreductase n=1 Tax=Vibrio sp. Of14-4 TaxID=2724878 RepID=UPI001EF2715B|nr:SgcJ/EcaC family oxidoreductase [Vibrio sp. Of14-4]
MKVMKTEILDLFQRWNDALQTGDPKLVSILYTQDAILLPTISNVVRHNHQEIEDYFDIFLQRKPVGTIDEYNIRIIGNIAINSGIYSFSFMDTSVVQARFTFVYRWYGNQWLIIEHHSSSMPEKSEV